MDLEEYMFKACTNGFLDNLKDYLQDNPDITIDSTYNNNYFDWFVLACTNGHLQVSQWLVQMKPDIDIFKLIRLLFRNACIKKGHKNLAIWLYQLSKERGKEINVRDSRDSPFISACYYGHIEMAQWLQSRKPHLYIIEYDEYGKIKDYKIRDIEEENWQRRKYLVWLATEHCPEQNKDTILYKLPSDVSRLLIGFV